VCTEFHGVPRTSTQSYSPAFYLRVVRHLGSRYPISVAKDYDPMLAERLQRLAAARPFDLYICDFLQPLLNFRGLNGAPTLLFQHNVESTILRRHRDTARNMVLRLFWHLQWRKMMRFEGEACRRLSGVVAVSDVDKENFEREYGAEHVFAIPTAVDADFFRPGTEPPEPGTIAFTGAMDWRPNEDAILWFADEILPRVRERVPAAHLLVIGRNPSSHLRARLARHTAITITGTVDDVRPFVQRSSVYVIPLRIGGGTRMKAYEAMAMGKPVVSTTIGVEGLPLVEGQHVIRADSTASFAHALADLLSDPMRAARLGQRARDYVVATFGWRRAAHAFAEACRAVIGARASVTQPSTLPHRVQLVAQLSSDTDLAQFVERVAHQNLREVVISRAMREAWERRDPAGLAAVLQWLAALGVTILGG
jgi:polysaccharide biosynthesis protein PslH